VDRKELSEIERLLQCSHFLCLHAAEKGKGGPLAELEQKTVEVPELQRQLLEAGAREQALQREVAGLRESRDAAGLAAAATEQCVVKQLVTEVAGLRESRHAAGRDHDAVQGRVCEMEGVLREADATIQRMIAEAECLKATEATQRSELALKISCLEEERRRMAAANVRTGARSAGS
jgi:hypothetical protein